MILSCARAGRIRIGRLGYLELKPGFYVYVGSAFGPGGLCARIGHHLRAAERPHWHIDYLRAATEIHSLWYSYAGRRREHTWARRFVAMPGAVVPLPGFGSSDCRCDSHLCWFERSPSEAALHARVTVVSARPEGSTPLAF